ncbi:hypothetical protein B0I35DRAFT_411703 [Stachybotrys elegans]|uniref:Uncharacterized protein n=1 Tax=Stachybotrys elegans TaxID=80388 RepID=A0A8K0WNL2_9HYPO|nr:hypothetical protein B0I35DRAFT_411703 [Stachybotrys elegans]
MPLGLKSYIVTPGSGFSFRRGGPIALGKIFNSALEVDDTPISFRDPKLLPPKYHPPSIEVNREITEDRGSKTGADVWLEYLRTFGSDIGLEASKNAHVIYKVEKLETDMFTGQGLHDYFEKRVKEEERLQKYLGKGPIYMVTGIKYANGLTWEIRLGTKTGAHAKGSAQIKEDIRAGGGVKNESEWSIFQKADVKEEAVFAYQVHKITSKGWRKSKRRLSFGLNRQGAALSDKSEGQEAEDGESEEDVVDIIVGEELESVSAGSFRVDKQAEDDGICMSEMDGEYMHAL